MSQRKTNSEAGNRQHVGHWKACCMKNIKKIIVKVITPFSIFFFFFAINVCHKLYKYNEHEIFILTNDMLII